MRYAILMDEVQSHGVGCSCGSCDSKGVAYGISVVKIPAYLLDYEEEMLDDIQAEKPIKTFYSPNKNNAFQQAINFCREKRWSWVVVK